ncbi:hypothetical protein B0H19DRAFT_1259156 [Mycena capillaripes]|nr:hypothetical protein B0H19DRAFT_1259156 [Mycena capillaripes]
MLRFVTVLVAVGQAVGIVVLDPVGTFQTGGKLALEWVSNVNLDPSSFDLELYSENWDSVSLLAKNVDTSADQLIVDLPPTLQPRTPPANSATTYGSAMQPSSTTQLNPPASSTTAMSSGDSTKSTYNARSTDVTIKSPPTSPESSSLSSSGTEPPQTQSAIRSPSAIQTQSATHIPRKSMSRGSIAGTAIGVLFLLILGFIIIWFCLRRSRRRRKPEVDLRPHIYSPTPRDEEQGRRESRFRGEKSRAFGAENRQEPLLSQPQEQVVVPPDGASRARIRAMEQDLESQTRPETSPPGYLD